jgi:hypothetical protein
MCLGYAEWLTKITRRLCGVGANSKEQRAKSSGLRAKRPAQKAKSNELLALFPLALCS